MRPLQNHPPRPALEVASSRRSFFSDGSNSPFVRLSVESIILESTEFLHCTRVFFNFHTKFRRLDAEVDPLLHQILETFVSRYFLADLSHTI
jgi:hypothetical protein